MGPKKGSKIKGGKGGTKGKKIIKHSEVTDENETRDGNGVTNTDYCATRELTIEERAEEVTLLQLSANILVTVL
jgi:hypothetical protein